MSKRNLSHPLRLLALAVLLTLPAPLHAMPLDGIAKGGLLEWLKGLVVSVWEEEGITIDPDGGDNSTGDNGMLIDPNGGNANSDEGHTIDPNG